MASNHGRLSLLSRYTFRPLTETAWLGIVLLAQGVHRIHPVYPGPRHAHLRYRNLLLVAASGHAIVKPACEFRLGRDIVP